MKPISDGDLLLFHYRDGLEATRLGEIEDALFYDAGLRLRLAALRETLAQSSDAWPAAESDAGLEGRVWTRLQPALPPRVVRATLGERLRQWLEPLRPAPLALGALMLATLGVGYFLGQSAVAPPTTPVAATAGGPTLLSNDAAGRVLSAYLGEHLQQTERALLVAANSPQDADAARELATSLLDSHRLYAVAADRAGKPALAQFLRELEPVLIELANEQGEIAPALGEEIRSRDLAFKSRAAAALARSEFTPSTQSL